MILKIQARLKWLLFQLYHPYLRRHVFGKLRSLVELAQCPNYLEGWNGKLKIRNLP